MTQLMESLRSTADQIEEKLAEASARDTKQGVVDGRTSLRLRGIGYDHAFPHDAGAALIADGYPEVKSVELRKYLADQYASLGQAAKDDTEHEWDPQTLAQWRDNSAKDEGS